MLCRLAGKSWNWALSDILVEVRVEPLEAARNRAASIA
jgi:hypothetical protein